MSNLNAKNIIKTYGTKSVLDGVSINVSEGDKIALVGENGSGKTTLMRILAGEEDVTSGSVIVDDYMPRLYMAQEFFSNPEETGMSFFANEKSERAVLRYLGELAISPKILETKTELLSGGQKKILQLIKMFCSNGPFLLLDEPENHLDYFAREWLVATLKNYRGSVIFVSHDQYIIDHVANKIVELEDGKLTVYRGDYKFFLEEKARQMNGRHQQWKHMEKEIERQRKVVVRMREFAKLNSDVAGVYRSRVKQLDRLLDARMEKPQLERKKMKLSVGDVDKKANKRILSIDDLSLRFGNLSIFHRTSLQLLFGEKVCLFGRNGSGKTSLFKMIQGTLKPTNGMVKLGVDLRVGYFSQEHHEELDPNKTPIDEVGDVMSGDEQKIRAFLSNFLIDSMAATRPISTLSGGQKTRLRFAKLFSREIDFLLLDEPTNHLDTLSWQVLVEAIKSFTGTVLLVSHDRAFVDEVVEKLWVINNSTIREFHGNLSELLGE